MAPLETEPGQGARGPAVKLDRPQLRRAAPSRLDEPHEYDFSEQVGHLLRRAYQRHLAIFQANACEPQITSTQFVTLCTLRDRGPSNQTDIIAATGIDQATIRGIVERLKQRGLVEFQSDPHDRRKVIVTLTGSGTELLQRMIPRAQQISELTMGDLNAAERAALMFTLKKMLGRTD